MKKRVIADDSSDSESGIPLSKRAKVDSEASEHDDGKHGANGNSNGATDMHVDVVGAQTNGHSKDDSDDDTPLAAVASTKKPTPSDQSDDDDVPLAQRDPKSAELVIEKPIKKPIAVKEASSDDERPVAKANPKPKPRAPQKSTPAKSKASKMDVDSDAASDSDDSEPIAKKAAPKKKAAPAKRPSTTTTARKPKVKAEEVSPQKPARGKKAVKEEGESQSQDEGGNDDDEDMDAWWLTQEAGDSSVKWNTLEHAGVLFPPPYVRLPTNVKLYYDGKPVELSAEAEEVAGFFAALKDSDHARKPVFVQNFFNDFLKVLQEHPTPDGNKIKEFEKCDFGPMADYFEAERVKNKSKSKEEKKADKEAKAKLEKPFTFCKLNGKSEKVGNFRIEPPGLFRGRGAHPKTGMLKRRVQPEQITINIGEGVPIPEPPAGHSWGKVQHDNTVSWLANWKENINGASKYVFLAANSSLKGKSDMAKFEKARALKHHVDRIRKDYTGQLTDKVMATRQRATAIYLIDRFALRAGNEKGDDEADTVGCCSLKCDNITLCPNDEVEFDFLGKDSIRFFQKFQVDHQVHKNFRIFKKDKTGDDLLFDRISTSNVNQHLKSYMDGLTAKVFRTYNASFTFVQELARRTKQDASVADKLLAYNRANRDVAVLCNHQRSVSKTHEASMGKMIDKLKALKYQRRKLRYALHTVLEREDEKLDESISDYEEDESDLDDEWIAKHEEALREDAKLKAQKKFEKAKEEGAAEAKRKVWSEEDYKAALEAADAEFKINRKETKTKKVETNKTAKKLLLDLQKKDAQIAAHRVAMTDKDEGKETSLGTSKLNYIDPRLTFAWCKKYNVPIEKVFSKTLREKFTWAASAPADFVW